MPLQRTPPPTRKASTSEAPGSEQPSISTAPLVNEFDASQPGRVIQVDSSKQGRQGKAAAAASEQGVNQGYQEPNLDNPRLDSPNFNRTKHLSVFHPLRSVAKRANVDVSPTSGTGDTSDEEQQPFGTPQQQLSEEEDLARPAQAGQKVNKSNQLFRPASKQLASSLNDLLEAEVDSSSRPRAASIHEMAGDKDKSSKEEEAAARRAAADAAIRQKLTDEKAELVRLERTKAARKGVITRLTNKCKQLEREAFENKSGMGQEARRLRLQIDRVSDALKDYLDAVEEIKLSERYNVDKEYRDKIDQDEALTENNGEQLVAAYTSATFEVFAKLNLVDPSLFPAQPPPADPPAAGAAGGAAAAPPPPAAGAAAAAAAPSAADFGAALTQAVRDATGVGYMGLPEPALKWDKFDGTELTKYPSFIKKFKDIVEKKHIAKEYQYDLLLSTLSGEAYDLVKGRGDRDDKYEATINDLDKEYGDRDVQVSAHFSKLRAKKRLTENAKATEVREMYTFLNDTFQALNTLGAEIDPTILLGEMECKLNKKLDLEWSRQANKYKNEKGREPKAQNCLNFLQAEAEAALRSQRRHRDTKQDTDSDEKKLRSGSALSAGKTDKKDKPSKKDDKNKSSGGNSNTGTKPKEKKEFKGNLRPGNDCPICQQHKKTNVAYCPEWKAASVDDRWKKVKEHNLCAGCGQPGHLLAACEKKRPCGIDDCKMSHRRDLHSSKSKSANAGSGPQTPHNQQ